MKGMVNGEPIKTGVVTEEYEKGHERTFGQPDPAFPRGRRFRWDPWQKKLVPAGFVEEKKAVNATVMVGRFYENQKTVEGEDIGSRRKHREYMRRNNLTTADDYSKTWEKEAQEREKRIRGEHDRQERREQVGRAFWEHFKP